MSAFISYFCSSVENFGRVTLEDFEFFAGAKIAFPGAAFVGAYFALYLPTNFYVFFIIFQVPNIVRQFCRRTLLDLVKAVFMVCVSLLEFGFGASYILFSIGFFVRFHCRFVHDGGGTTFAVQWARLTAVARFRHVSVGFAEGFVMAGYDGFHARGATVTDLNGITIKNFAVAVV